MKYFTIITISILLLSCSEASVSGQVAEADVNFDVVALEDTVRYSLLIEDALNETTFEIFKDEHFRGLDIYENTAWVAGTHNSLLEFDFSVAHSNILHLPVDEGEYRDLDCLGSGEFHLLQILKPASIKKYTLEKGDLDTTYESDFAEAFLDGLAFWENGNGLAFGDPLDGFHYVLKTNDKGKSWNRIPENKLPAALEIEAGFAASGTSIVCVGDGVAYIGLGGTKARVLKTEDYGESWVVLETPMLHGTGGKGIYAMAFKDELNGVAVGGNWENTSCDSSKIFTTDGGASWQLALGIQEYRSCVMHYKNKIYIATGTSGTDISYDNGQSWELLDSIGFNALQFNKQGLGLGIGNKGVIKKLRLVE